jgi:hypothetical protein
MPTRTISIDKYIVSHHLFGQGQTKIYYNFIYCYSGGSPVGRISFIPGDQVPDSNVITSPFFFYLNFESDKYQDIIETLRNEKAVYVSVYWDENSIITNGSVSNSNEPIGEQEGSGVPA